MQLFIIITLVVSFAFALIGITTNYWYQSLANEFNEGLWVRCHRESSITHSSLDNEICNKQPYFRSQGLAVSGLTLLSIAIILSTIRRYRKNDRLLVYLTIVILVGSTLLLVFSYLLYPRQINFQELGYSIYFMLISSLISLVSTGLVAFSATTMQST
jgi:vacuolar-type H+-ATPase subunit I/STV1